ncbi:unnamed protein product [Bursaphelenchus okinawaensis]|uniref:Uncharacterized protein n=1 Tax=Bursaphelenchus okinawaensis TaxID=465554 RepID=A0A811JVC1_9BILA|nr:unnamed protein product [Bursaphelenchus okinawaensis]CAG9084666.1 unnamed protein product [Bursaphelenchus okinawaensis]
MAGISKSLRKSDENAPQTPQKKKEPKPKKPKLTKAERSARASMAVAVREAKRKATHEAEMKEKNYVEGTKSVRDTVASNKNLSPDRSSSDRDENVEMNQLLQFVMEHNVNVLLHDEMIGQLKG